MPVRAVLQQMGYVVECDADAGAVIVKSKNFSTNSPLTNEAKTVLMSYEEFVSSLTIKLLETEEEWLKRKIEITPKGELIYSAAYTGNLSKEEFKPKWLSLDQDTYKEYAERYIKNLAYKSPTYIISVLFEYDLKIIGSRAFVMRVPYTYFYAYLENPF